MDIGIIVSIVLFCVLGVFVLIIVSTVLFFFLSQDKLLYGMKREHAAFPDEHQVSHESLSFRTEDGVRLHGWLLIQPESTSRKVATLIILLGQGANARLELSRGIEFHKAAYNVLVVSYRGSGRSEGYPTEEGIRRDGKAIVLYASNRRDVVDVNKLFVFGVSLGGAVALSLAANPEVASLIRGVIVENTFTSMDDILNSLSERWRVLNFFCKMGLLTRLNRNKWYSLKVVEEIRLPVLFLSGMKDEIVPPFHMRRLYNKTVSPEKVWKEFADGGHADTWKKGGKEYYEALRSFVESCIARQSIP